MLNYEMESATLLTMCATNGWRAGCVAGVIAQRTEAETDVDDETVAATEELAVRVVVDAARRML